MTALYKVSQNRKMANYILSLLMVALLSFISVCAETPLRAACGPPVEHFIEKSKDVVEFFKQNCKPCEITEWAMEKYPSVMEGVKDMYGNMENMHETAMDWMEKEMSDDIKQKIKDCKNHKFHRALHEEVLKLFHSTADKAKECEEDCRPELEKAAAEMWEDWLPIKDEIVEHWKEDQAFWEEKMEIMKHSILRHWIE